MNKLSLAALGAVLSACATVPPPKELTEARKMYDQAQGGLAAKLAPAALDGAKQALQRAERSFRDTEDSVETRALGYIAERRARLAEAAGDVAFANQEKLAAEAAFKEKSTTELDRARTTIESEKQKTEEARKAREEADRGRAEAEKGRKEAERVAAAALASLKEMASVKEEQRGVVITLSGAVLFTSGKSDLLAIAKEKLTEVFKVLKDQSFPKLRIEGHTDSVGSAEENRRLSLARAESVKAHLVSLGYPADRITTAGLGPDTPVAENGTAEGRANNRRVEIIVNPVK